MNYKKSRYNLSKKINNNLLIYNLVSNQVAVLNDEYREIFENCDKVDQLDEHTYNILKQLYNIGFIVEQEKNEVAFVNSRRHSMLYYNTHEKCFVILPTTDCNARCYYCYQDGWQTITMTEEIADKAVDFIKRTVKENDKVMVAWFGGEPLYNYPIAKKINDALKTFFGDRYSSTMTTNGSLITRQLAKELKNDWNMAGIQITIDNLFEKYDIIKAFIDKTTFQDVINAIGYCLDNGLNIIARINLSKSNIQDFERIYEFLEQKFGNNELFQIAVEFLKEEMTNGNITNYFSEKEYPSVLKTVLDIKYKYSSKTNINKFLCPQKDNTCLAQSNQHIVISPDGKLYKCQHIHEQDCVGNLDDGIIFNDALAYFMNPNISKKCEKCLFLPCCHGGCLNYSKYGMAVGGMCARIKYDYSSRLDIIYRIYNYKINKEVN